MRTLRLKDMIIIAESAVILAVFSQVSFSLGPIPLTGQTFAVGVLATVFDKRKSTLIILLYLLLGLIGLPVFAGFSSGITPFMGPTGGFLLGFIPTAWFVSWALEKKQIPFWYCFLINALGGIITLIIGMLWFQLYLGETTDYAFKIAVLPFIIPGVIKALLAAWLGLKIQKRLMFMLKK